jgi:hypothetical protein
VATAEGVPSAFRYVSWPGFIEGIHCPMYGANPGSHVMIQSVAVEIALPCGGEMHEQTDACAAENVFPLQMSCANAPAGQ